MKMPHSETLATELIWHDAVASTNDAMRALVEANPEQPNRSVLATDTQTAGRGRNGRVWVSPAGKALAFSVLLRRRQPMLAPTWLPLIAGSAVRRGVERVLSDAGVAQVSVGVKWPNDVLAKTGDGAWRKIAGVLSEMLPDGSVIVGIGINTTATSAELPTDEATSLAMLAGAQHETGAAALGSETAASFDPDAVLAAILTELFALLDELADRHVDEVRGAVITDLITLSTRVRAILPGGEVVEGTAVRLSDEGGLVIARADAAHSAAEAAEVMVAAADIEHLR